MLDEREPFTGVALGCAGDKHDEVVVVDPTGVEPPRTIFTAPACNGRWAKHGIVSTMRDEDGSGIALVFQRYPADTVGPPVEPVRLLDAVGGVFGFLAVRDDELLVVDTVGDLIRIELPSGTATIEQANVSVFALSSDARYLAFMHELDAPLVDDVVARGDLHLRDRLTGTELVVEDASILWPSVLDVDGFAWLWLGEEYGVGTRVVDLETMAMYAIPDDRELWLRRFDGRWLTESAPGRFAMRDLATGGELALPELELHGNPRLWDADATGIQVVDGTHADGPLLRLDYDGSPPQVLARRVEYSTTYPRLDDGRLVTRVDIENRWEEGEHGVLVVVEPDSFDEHVVDDHVVNPAHVDLGTWFGDNAMMYAVDDGERSGVWLARVAD